MGIVSLRPIELFHFSAMKGKKFCNGKISSLIAMRLYGKTLAMRRSKKEVSYINVDTIDS
tara:strand:+ start:18 stop:197 length:180 start_codon:yes stop_codon:yes gene_type:complete